jgi:hypothetical protein
MEQPPIHSLIPVKRLSQVAATHIHNPSRWLLISKTKQWWRWRRRGKKGKKNHSDDNYDHNPRRIRNDVCNLRLQINLLNIDTQSHHLQSSFSYSFRVWTKPKPYTRHTLYYRCFRMCLLHWVSLSGV